MQYASHIHADSSITFANKAPCLPFKLIQQLVLVCLVLAGRLSYLYGLNGPSIAIDTACSSSLVAVGVARNALLLGIAGGALAGGITLLMNPATMAMYAVAGATICDHDSTDVRSPERIQTANDDEVLS